jgi:hypothetical protein
LVNGFTPPLTPLRYPFPPCRQNRWNSKKVDYHPQPGLKKGVEIGWHSNNDRQEQLQSRKWELETLLSDRRVELASLEIVTRYVDNLRSLLEESSLTERKSFIKSFVKEVKVTGAEVLLTYTMPLPPQGIYEERVGVLYFVHYGGVCSLFAGNR